MKFRIEIQSILARKHSAGVIAELNEVYPENDSKKIFRAKLPEEEPRIIILRDILDSYGLKRRSLDSTDSSWQDPDTYGWTRVIDRFDPEDWERAQYFMYGINNPDYGGISPNPFEFRGDGVRPGLCDKQRIYAKPAYKKHGKSFSYPDMAYNQGNGANEVVSDRLRGVLEEAGLIGLDFLPIQLDEGNWGESIPVDWSDYGMPRYWALSSPIQLPPRSQRWTKMETEGLRDENDLKWTPGAHKYDKTSLDFAEVQPFDIAMDMTHAHPFNPTPPPPANAGTPVVSRRFLDVLKEAGIDLEPWPVFVLDQNAEPLVY